MLRFLAQILLEQLIIVAHLVTKLHASYGTRRFITVFTKAHSHVNLHIQFAVCSKCLKNQEPAGKSKVTLCLTKYHSIKTIPS